MSNRCRVFGPCIFYALRKIKAKCSEVILVLASNQRKPYEVLIIQGKPTSPNLEKVEINKLISAYECALLSALVMSYGEWPQFIEGELSLHVGK